MTAELARLKVLAEASRVFAEATLKLDSVLSALACLVAETLGDGCAIRLLDESGEWLSTATLHHVDPGALELLGKLVAPGPIRPTDTPSGRVVLTGEPLLVPEISLEALRPQAKPEYLPYLERYPVHSFLAVPLKVHGKILGNVVLNRDHTPAPFTPADLALVIELAERAALSIENARLLEALRKSRADAERRVDDQRFLYHLGESLAQTPTDAELLLRITTQLGEYLDLSRCFFAEIDIENDRGTIHREYYRGGVSIAGTYPLSTFGNAGDEANSGHIVTLNDAKTDPRTAQWYESAYERLGFRALVAVPLMREGRRVGTLSAVFSEPRVWQDREVALLQEVAERTWFRLEQLRLDAALKASNDRAQKLREQVEQDQRFVLELGLQAVFYQDGEELLYFLATRLGEYLTLSRCIFTEVDAKRENSRLHRDYYRSPPSLAGSQPLASFSPETRAEYEAGRIVPNHDVRNDPRTAALFEKVYAPLGAHAILSVPLVRNGRWVASLNAIHDHPHNWTTREIGLVQSVAEKAWLWIEHVRMVAELEKRVAARTKELERSNEDLAQFAYVASHDLRAPLRAIDTLSEWLETARASALTADTRQQMDLLRSRVRRMDRLLSDLLDYARIGRGSVNLEEVSVIGLLREVEDLLNLPAGFVIETTGLQPTFTTARIPLQRVLLNLIGNAVKHHDRTNGRIQITVADAYDYYAFTVADDGPGIPPEFHQRVFQMFQTLKSRDTVEGSGMGLALVKRIVETFGGTIELESPGGRGTTVRFTWPKEWAIRMKS